MPSKQNAKETGVNVLGRSLSRRLLAAITRRGSSDSTASTASNSSTNSTTTSTASSADTDLSDPGDGSRRAQLIEQVIKTEPVEEELLCDYLSDKFGEGNYEICLRTDTYYLKIPQRLADAEIRHCCI